MSVSPVPSGYHSVTPYLIIDGAASALAWYVLVFGAREVMRLSAPEGKIGHAEIQIGDSRVMIADQSAESEARGPASFGGSPVSLHVYVSDVDAIVARAVAADAEVKKSCAGQVLRGSHGYGARSVRSHLAHFHAYRGRGAG
jgi:PhnB protein